MKIKFNLEALGERKPPPRHLF